MTFQEPLALRDKGIEPRSNHNTKSTISRRKKVDFSDQKTVDFSRTQILRSNPSEQSAQSIPLLGCSACDIMHWVGKTGN